MINCIVSRRHGQGRKAHGPRLTVPEHPSSAPPDFSRYSADDNFLSNRRWSSQYDAQGPGAFSQQPGMFSVQGITVDGRHNVVDEQEIKESTAGRVQRPSRGDKMLSKHFIAPCERRNRRASLHGCDFRSMQESAIESDQVLHPKEVLYLQKTALASNEEARRKNLSEVMAHVSLDGRIMNAVSATCASTIGGDLGEEESQAWDSFAPLQRVLIVAVAAAASASTKQKNHKEINRLQRAVSTQENALTLMRRELSNLWDQVAAQENGPLSFMTPNALEADSKARSVSPETPVHGKQGQTLEVRTDVTVRGTPKTYKRIQSKTDPSRIESSWTPCKGTPINKGIVLSESPAKDGTQTDLEGEAKWYNNPLMDHSGESGHSGQSGKSTQSEHYFEDCTPEKRRRIFSRFTPDTRDPVEWLSVKSSFTTISADAVTPLTHKKRLSNEGSNGLSRADTADLEELAVMRVRCASILMEVKNQVLSVLDKEASQVMGALSHVIEKAQKLERMERPSTLSRRVHTPEKKAQASAALKESVEKASAHVASLQAAVVSIWHTIGPQALASLNLSPTEIESYLLRVSKETLLNNDGKSAFAVTEGGVQAWKQWVQANHNETSIPSMLSKLEAAAKSHTKESNKVLCSPSWRHKGGEIASAIGSAVRKTVDSLMAPLDGRRAEENYQSPIAKQRVSTLSVDAPEFLANQLLGELEKAAAKVAGMESQMLSLKQYVRESDAKREKAELKLAEAIARENQIQEKFEREMNELTKQLREKESAYEDLMRSRKVMFSVKSKEIAELRDDCQRRDAALDDITAAAQATRDASNQRLAVLEDICKRKDSAIYELKQEIFALESKVHDLKLRSPLLLRGDGRGDFGSLPSRNEEVLALEHTFNEVSRERAQNPLTSPIDQFVAVHSSMADMFGQLRSSTSSMPPTTMDPRAQETTFFEFYAERPEPSPPPKDFLPVPSTRANGFDRVRSSTSSLPNTTKEFIAPARPLACSIDGSLFPSPTSIIFDDFLDLESSLLALAVDEGGHPSADVYTQAKEGSLCVSQEYFSAREKSSSCLKKLKNITTGLFAESSGSTTKTSNVQRVRGTVAFTSSDENKKPNGVLRPTKTSYLKAHGKAKATKKENDIFGLKKKEEFTWVDAGILASVDFNNSFNGSVNSRRTSSNSSIDAKEGSGKSKDHNNIKRRRWL